MSAGEVIRTPAPPEGPKEKAARFAVGSITQKEHKLFQLRTQIENLEIEIKREAEALVVKLDLAEKEIVGRAEMRNVEPQVPAWVGYWRRIGIPHWQRREVGRGY